MKKSLTIRKIISFLIIVLILNIVSIAHAQELQGKVIGITDGDTFTLLASNYNRIQVRMAEIDAPEKGQPYGNQSQKTLASLIFKQHVSVEKIDHDRYGRLIGRVKVIQGNTLIDANREMVRLGAAWVYRRYMRDQTLLEVEYEAKTQRRGLWSLFEADRIPPWEWRSTIQKERQS